MIHLTYTGLDAGTYLCLRYRTRLGSGRETAPRAEGDEGVHAGLAPEAILTSPDLCPDCNHVFRCPVPDCPRCLALGYAPDDPAAATPTIT